MQDIKTLKRLLYQVYSILTKKQRIQMIGIFVSILIGTFFELLGVSAILPFIQSVLNPEELMNKSYIRFFCDIFGITSPGSVVYLVGIGIILIYLIKNAYLMFSSYLQALFNNNTQKELSMLMLNTYVERPYSFFVDNGSDVIMEGVNGDMNGVYQIILNGFNLLTELLTVVTVSAYLIITDWVLAVGVLIVGLICFAVIVLLLKNRISQLSVISRKASREKYKTVLQITGGIKDIFVYCRQKFFLNEYEKVSENACKASVNFTFIGALPKRLIEAFCIPGIIVTVLIRFKMGVNVDSFVPQMGVFAVGAFRLLPSVSNMVAYINAFIFYRRNVESAYDNILASRAFIEEQKSWADKLPDEKHYKLAERKFDHDIKVCDLVWKYKEGKDRVLDGLNITVHKGEAVGIIGESGSGKSTFADILLRLYHPQSGSIQMDGVNIDSIPDVWSSVIGYVPQSVFLIDDTIRANVIFGASEPDDEKVWDALRRASLDRFVKDLPNGLDTIVGERGIKFSGGQRQRIAIARALYSDPMIMIMDEATSALDNETEEAVMEAIDALAGSVTLVIIAHRVTTLKNCDKIYEITDGKAVERNKEEVLLKAITSQGSDNA